MMHIQNIYDKLGWKKATGYPVGTRIKVLRDEKRSKDYSVKTTSRISHGLTYSYLQ